jgi:putative tricarboxylic transport membrane protein
MMETIEAVVATPAFEEVRRRNSWTLQLKQGDDFYQFLEQQELEIGTLMRQLGFLRPLPSPGQ